MSVCVNVLADDEIDCVTFCGYWLCVEVYGVVFYFDQEIDYMRCRSMGDNIPKLAHLFGEELS
jgi:hypothetical protein